MSLASTSEMTCQELVELVSDYLGGTLSAVDRTRFEAHLADCDDCPVYLEQMRLTIHSLGRLTEERLTPAAKTELMRLFQDWKSDVSGGR